MKKVPFSRLVAFVAACSTGVVFAAVPPAVTTAIEAMGTDAALVANAVLVAIIGVAAIKFIRKGI